MKTEKELTIDALRGEVTKKHGEVFIDMKTVKKCDVIRTGSLAVDIATGIGGIPKGRFTEISGEASSGKTTLVLQTVAEAQRQGGECLFIDAEYSLDGSYARNLGVDMDRLTVAQPETAEQALDMMMTFANSGIVSTIVVDSVAAMVPRAVMEGEVDDKHMALIARLFSQQSPKLVAACAKNNVAAIFVNQLRSNMGSSGPYGPTTTTTGGKSLPFYFSLRMTTSRTGSTKDGDMVVGNATKVKVTKNKLAPPFTEAVTEIRFGEGYWLSAEILGIGAELKLIEKSGSWYSYNGERIGQGRDNSCDFLDSNPEIRASLEKTIREMYNIA